MTPSGDTLVTYNLGDIAFVLISMVLVFIMIPGVGFFYSGLLRRKNALSMLHMSMLSVAVVTFQVWLLPNHKGPITEILLSSGSSGVTPLPSVTQPAPSWGI